MQSEVTVKQDVWKCFIPLLPQQCANYYNFIFRKAIILYLLHSFMVTFNAVEHPQNKLFTVIAYIRAVVNSHSLVAFRCSLLMLIIQKLQIVMLLLELKCPLS